MSNELRELEIDEAREDFESSCKTAIASLIGWSDVAGFEWKRFDYNEVIYLNGYVNACWQSYIKGRQAGPLVKHQVKPSGKAIMLSDEEKLIKDLQNIWFKSGNCHLMGETTAMAIIAKVERAVLAKASQQVQDEPVQYTNAQVHGCKFEGWQCFHCGEVFTTVGGARDHFGADPTKDPGCLIKVKVGDERGLEMELRKVEGERDLLRLQIANGTTEIENSVQEMLTNHRIALRHAEEEGYRKGLDEGMNLAMPTPKQEPYGYVCENKITGLAEFSYIDTADLPYDGAQWLSVYLKHPAQAAAKQEPVGCRITDQDANDIIESYVESPDCFNDWIGREGRTLLNKLNENPAPAQAAATPESNKQ